VKDSDKELVIPAARDLIGLGFTLVATDGTARVLEAAGLAVTKVNKVAEGRPHIVDRIKDGDIALIFNTTEGVQSLKDSTSIRSSALYGRVPYFTTAAASIASVGAIAALRRRPLEVKPLQAYHQQPRA
jgi:carbamoyl-phosphate synthase large subunit